ncbi:TlpA disulfide reductase family protein [Winogradskyella bathintestinalis]|uniref:TlpA disulfide reductase family protein n=1 Tax=Winogradskyella bathintestinalis TaxID=3035208 RepID=A0ABT7ZWP1_9FLAO|nr:TlpA disulfide reductase family protein [Winogradskyella bathintestinalis]MDN3493387.1 TlpA disulfide reductase family protein [Winogradskyella bathintestinalis]
MKLKNILTISIVTLLMACEKKTDQVEGGYLLNVTMKDYSEPYIYWDMGEGLDSMRVDNGKFSISNTLESPQQVNFRAKENIDQSFIIYLENSIIDASVDFSKDRFNDPDFIEVRGSEAHEIKRKIDWDVMKYSDQKYKGASDMALAKYKTETFYFLLKANPKYINDAGFEQAYYYFAFYLPTAHFPYEEAKQLLDIFKDKYGDTERFKAMQRKIDVALKRKIGTPFINYTINNTEGEEVKLSDSYGSRFTLIDVWASWCGPCRKENPNYKKILKKYKDRGFQIIAVSLDNDKQRWVDAIKEDRTYEFVHVSELNGRKDLLSKTYGINGIPDSFLLDKDGIIIENSLRGEGLTETLEYLYAN